MKLKLCFVFGFFLYFSVSLIAQSDFRITQEFKSRQRSYEIAIEYAKSNDELEKIKKEIAIFKNEFKGNKELLNRALYPSNFESSFEILTKKIAYTNKKLAEISTLQTKVEVISTDFEKVNSELKKMSGEYFTLRKTNTKLMAELRAFQSGYGGSKSSIDSLNNLITQLKVGISRRDTLIKEILDNIFATAEHKIESLNDTERKSLKTQIQGTSLIDNINNLINDNIEFIDASLFTSDDLLLLKDEYTQFDQRWKHFGPKLYDIYSNDTLNQEKLNNIDTLLFKWDNSLSKSIWKSVKEVFSYNNISLDNFESGEEFENVLINYITEEINNSNSEAELEKDQNYVFFAERAWKETFKPKWMPILISSKLLTIEQIGKIEDKLVDWKNTTGGSKSYFIYAIILFLAIIIVISIIFINKRNAERQNNFSDKKIEEDDVNELDFDDDDEDDDDEIEELK